MSKRSNDGFFWSLFSVGGVISAFLIPIHVFLFALALPLGWLPHGGYEHLLALVRTPEGRVYLFVLCSFSLFHWAHRFRFTLYDGLQIKHLNEAVFAACYGTALIGTVLAAYLVLTL